MSDDVITVNEIAADAGEPTYSVRYALSRFGPAPVLRLRNAVLYSRNDLPAIREALAKTASRSTDPERRARYAARYAI